ncbi:MAG: hypothetical protein NC182_07040 [Prevotella sp.]|nr:hypothetical protein [Staphylococcus sp.]MCM1350938.1 hypothetical protein [Prevotella sp.]
MKKMIVFWGIVIVIALTSCTNSYQVNYIIDNDVYQTVEIQKGKRAEAILAPQKENQVFIGWMYEGKLFSFDNKIEKNMTFIAQYDSICQVEGHQLKAADCTHAKTCIICGQTEGNAKGHTWLDATYQAPQTCTVCGETIGTKLFYQPVECIYEIDIQSAYLTISQYENLKDYLKVFAILKDGKQVELPYEDMMVTTSYQIHPETNMSGNYIELSYNGMTIGTSKMLLGIFENIPFALNELDVEKDSSFISSEHMGQCQISHSSLETYLLAKGYTNMHQYLLDLGWEMPGLSKQYNPLTELVYIPILYYVKDGYCLYIDEHHNMHPTTGEFVDFIQISKIPDAFYKIGLDQAISSYIQKLYFLTRDIKQYTIQENEEVLLKLTGNGYSMHFASFSNVEKDQLISNIEALCAQKGQTYEIEGMIYVCYRYKEGVNLIVNINPTSDTYADISITWMEIK